jgi:hypothetical protein
MPAPGSKLLQATPIWLPLKVAAVCSKKSAESSGTNTRAGYHRLRKSSKVGGAGIFAP